jgi:hypothetical protein
VPDIPFGFDAGPVQFGSKYRHFLAKFSAF